MQKFSDTVATSVNNQLIVLSAATVNVYLTGTTTSASIYSTNGGVAKANPFQSSATGLIEFYAADGRYDIVVSKAGYTTVTLSDQLFEDPATGGVTEVTTLTASGQITSTVSTGTAPLVIASTTKVTNLNADLLDGGDWAAPGAIGSTTPSTGAFTTLSASGQSLIGTATAISSEQVQIQKTAAGSVANNLRLTNTGTTVGSGSGVLFGAYTNGGVYTDLAGVLVGSSGATSGYLALGTTNAATYAERLRIDSAGNGGWSVTPYAWGSSFTALDLRTYGSLASTTANTYLYANAYYNGTNWIYKQTAAASGYSLNTGQHQWVTAPSGTAGNAITFTQSLAVGNGTTLALEGATSAAGTGIAFPATQLASSNANTLDDYEEGTFTPTIEGTTLAGAGTYTFQNGRYTKIGRLVHVMLSVAWTAHTGTGNMRISGLPFTSVTSSTAEWPCVPEFVNMTMPANTTPFAIVSQNSTNVSVYSQAVGAGNVTALAMDTAASIYLTVTYEAA